MCEFCVKHGDGKRWYLNAANYAEDLLYDIRRVKYIEDFVPEMTDKAARWLRVVDRGRRISRRLTERRLRVQSRAMKKIHYGQVVPIEDVESIMGIVGQVVRLPCICRDVLEKKQRAVCYALAASPDRLGYDEIIGRREEGMPFVEGMERVTPQQALEEMAALEGRGNIHTVWTFLTPFIGAICNCDPAGCLAMNFAERGLSLYFPGEDLADVDGDSCTGCGACTEICLFDAVTEKADGTAVIDGDRCHGCGICRRVCETDAITLRARAAVAAAVP